MKQKTAIVSVINDLVTDQRVDRACRAILKKGYQVTLVGRIQAKSLTMNDRPYATHRMRLLFSRGPVFYLEYQIRLFLFLLYRKSDLLWANDLDTLLPNFLISKLKKSAIIYDSHELFCEVPELLSNPKKRNTWKRLERWIFPKLDKIITVNQSIANIYSHEYEKEIKVVRNIPLKRKLEDLKTREELGLPEGKKIIILQGAGINMQRGSEEAVEAMQWVDNAILLIVGSGDVIEQLKQMRVDLALEEKVMITGKVPYEKLAQYTQIADLGLSFDKDTNLNYRFSLPNKLFDYIHADVPVLVSNLVEIVRIVKDYQIGDVIENHEPKYIAKKMQECFSNKKRYFTWTKNLKKAQSELTWDTEERKIIELIEANPS